ncbi:hypothetical protein [Neorhodopirellula pilleata]|nr:hypothetical protein [Neorhodopirellula pilleata]
MRHDLRDDPACLTLSDNLSDTFHATVGRLFVFWSWVDRHSADGTLANATKSTIDRLVERDGFADGMIDVGWLVTDGETLIVPQFTRHNGSSAKARELESEAKRLRRKEQKPLSDKCPTLSDKTSDQEKRRGEKNNKKGASAKFIKPTVEEVAAYCRERGNQVDPTKFVDHYETTGWRRGKSTVKDWRACVRTWERSDTNSSTSKQSAADKRAPTLDELAAMPAVPRKRPQG